MFDVVVATALVDMYTKFGSIDKAHKVFDKMPQIDVVLWTAMLAGYAQNGLVEKALEICKKMKLLGLKPNSLTFASILPNSGSINKAHELFDKICYEYTT